MLWASRTLQGDQCARYVCSFQTQQNSLFLYHVHFKQMVTNEDKQKGNTLLYRPFECQIFSYFKMKISKMDTRCLILFECQIFNYFKMKISKMETRCLILFECQIFNYFKIKISEMKTRCLIDCLSARSSNTLK
jgi:hypothetical protein